MMPDETPPQPQDEETRPEEAKPNRLTTIPLSKVQAYIGIGAGLLTIMGTGASFMGIAAYRGPVQGEVITSVTAARYRTPLQDATVEILTATNAVVTTLNADEDGRVQYRLREGQYRLRVSHPQYMPDQKDIQIWSGQKADVRVALALKPPPPRVVVPAAPKPAPSPPQPAPIATPVAVVEEPNGFKRFFEKLGF